MSTGGVLGLSRAQAIGEALVRSAAHVRLSVDSLLFAGGLLVFLITRFVGLDRFPIFFFTDEAVQTVRAASLVGHGFRDESGHLFPTYFRNGLYLNLSVSVYAQIIPYKLFGETEFATRATSVLVCLSGTAAVGLLLRDIYKVSLWWAGVLLLAITPAWFIHSRTAFETGMAVSFYTWFLYFYLRARYYHPRNLFPALFFFALAFYTYSATQLVVVVSGVLLGASDIRHHLRHWKYSAAGLALLAILAVPQLRFQLQQGGEISSHLRALGSYWVDKDLSLTGKLHRFWHEYATGISPGYWFSTHNTTDLVRHQMKGYGNMLLPTLPFLVVGLGACLIRVRQSAYRALLIALIAAPTGGALVGTAVTRDLVAVIPAALLTTIGLATVLSPLRRLSWHRFVGIPVFIVLAGTGFWMLHDALVNGPTWFTNYGLYGMQYGAPQVAGTTRQLLAGSPSSQVYIASTWTNGADVVFQFFFPDDPRVRVFDIDGFIQKKLTMPADSVFVVTSDQYDKVSKDPRFADIKVLKTLPYPTGAPGFYILRLRYSDNADAIFAAEAEARKQLVEEPAMVDGQQVTIRHSQLDLGSLQAMFDGDFYTLGRTLEANPAIVEMTFAEPRLVSGLTISTGTMHLNLTAIATPADGGPQQTYSYLAPKSERDPTATLDFGASVLTRVLRIEIGDADGGDGHIHIREIHLR